MARRFLRQLDLTGTASLRRVVTLSSPKSANPQAATLTVAPNPSEPGRQLTLTLTGRANQALQLN
ncbi:hypothetical protein [Hymenobacter lapidiphilus]|uniref:Uncharacterized protein n=1 Tax=Hymenobacter lapidiphilus TaxID=2608003 RepID=A0A7Y7PKW8_9BACT|nr:hypothetical protein [Hymenobacter lapidiphilus]NVO29691.1 hypothetical protein [Hymenobacter lapidiphilus]